MNLLYPIGVLIVSASLLGGCMNREEQDAHALFRLKCKGAGGMPEYNSRTNMHDCWKPLFSEYVLGD